MDVFVRHKNGETVNTIVDDEKFVKDYSMTHLRNIDRWESNDMFLKFISGKDCTVYYFKLDTVYNFVIEHK